uniref:alpha,alpha-trehalose-phosphate synthase (UDP-forming) n=1 Tax=Moniliella megachiliensis TaxID=203381 RepID=A0A024F8C7_9BASI|nr:trehalose-6-phosphate synthase2 [Moniliella megachiliensis]
MMPRGIPPSSQATFSPLHPPPASAHASPRLSPSPAPAGGRKTSGTPEAPGTARRVLGTSGLASTLDDIHITTAVSDHPVPPSANPTVGSTDGQAGTDTNATVNADAAGPGSPDSKPSDNASPATDASSSSAPRLIVVSNRLPVTIKRDPKAEGGFTFRPSSGGLVSALAGVKKTTPFVWIGWPGLSVPAQDRDFIESKLRTEFSCEPVWLPDDIADGHYNGFSNSVLWPLYHYRPGEMNFDEASWLAYRQANLMFAQRVRSVARRGDMIWVHDYHLMLLPLMLRTLIEGPALQGRTSQLELEHIRKGLNNHSILGSSEDLVASGSGRKSTTTTESVPASDSRGRSTATRDGTESVPRGSIKIGFFLHTPFPSSEIYRILPVRREILLGILHCDLIGFHTYDYARHFLSSCTRILGMTVQPNGLAFEGRYVHVGAYPIGIEPQSFYSALKTPEVQNRMQELLKHFEGKKVIIGVDRLDYIKGVPQKMLGFETFLHQHPEYAEQCVLIQVAVPSRQDVEEYQSLRCSVSEMVGRINSEFGTATHMPIHFLHKSVSFPELVALYAVSDACLVTSTRDGMNLVSYEYIACQAERCGVMILSEFAGAAQSLNGSVIINPWDKQAVADSIYEALTMPLETRSKNVAQLRAYVDKHTAQWWGSTYVRDLSRIRVSRLRSESPALARLTHPVGPPSQGPRA